MDTDINNQNQEDILHSQKTAEEIITNSTAKASTIAALPIPLIDMAGVAYVQVSMVEKLAKHYQLEDIDKSKIIISSIISGMVSKLCTEIVNSIAASTNLEKLLSEALIKATIAGFMTTITGEVFNDHFKSGGNIEEIDVDTFLDYFKRQLQSDRLSIDQLTSNAFDKISSKLGIVA